MSWVEIKKVNGDMSKTLDELIKEKMSRTVQTVRVRVESYCKGYISRTKVEIPIEVDTQKTQVILNTHIAPRDKLAAVNYGLEDSKHVFAYYEMTGYNTSSSKLDAFDITLTLITQG